jgi:hypothetical protein
MESTSAGPQQCGVPRAAKAAFPAGHIDVNRLLVGAVAAMPITDINGFYIG